MTEPVRVLVTAVGGPLGQGIVKALRLSSFPVQCYGCDMDPYSAGRAFVERFFPVPPAARVEEYREAIDDICRSSSIAVVVPASEPEIYLLSKNLHLSSGTAVLCQPAAWIETYGDKLKCMEALKGRIDLAGFADGTNARQVRRLRSDAGFPLVVKPRRSSGSANFTVVHDEQQLAAALARIEAPLVQEFIDSESGEFSVGVFVCEFFQSVICFKRQLGPGGGSWIAETVDDEAVLAYARRIAYATRANGSVNIQVRRSSRGVRLLEINPRFSSLVAARALSGFRDLEWSLELKIGRIPQEPARPFRHVQFRRFLHEVVDLGSGFGAVSAWAPRSSV